MKVIVHHLPTGCMWEREVDINRDDFEDKCLEDGKGFILGNMEGSIYFPPDVISQSVVKVIA